MSDFEGTPGAYGVPPEVDGMILRYLDGEGSASSGAETRALLEASPEARERLEELSLSSDLLSDHLADIPIPATPELHFPPTLPALIARHRMAAGIVLLLLSVSLLTPARAWIVVGIRAVASVLIPEEEAVLPAPAEEAGPSTVSFGPVGSELVVTVRDHQASGRLTVVVVDGTRASGEASGEGTGVELLMLPNGIEVRNGPGSMADYTVRIPRSLRSVRVRVGGREQAVIAPGDVEVGHTWVFELTAPRG
jgi:anti-sigma factor RsiW